MSVTSWTELILIVSAISGAIGWLIKFHADRRRDGRELGKIDVETFVLLRAQVGEMEEKIVKLRDRIDILETQLDTKEAAIKQKDADITQLQAQVNKLDTRLNKILIYVSGLLRELNERGIQYTPPEPGVLDTDPNIQAIRGKK